jgi:hypothetical protein
MARLVVAQFPENSPAHSWLWKTFANDPKCPGAKERHTVEAQSSKLKKNSKQPSSKFQRLPAGECWSFDMGAWDFF